MARDELPAVNNMPAPENPRSKRKRLQIIFISCSILVVLVTVIICLSVLIPPKLHHNNSHHGGDHHNEGETHHENNTQTGGDTYNGGDSHNGDNTPLWGGTSNETNIQPGLGNQPGQGNGQIIPQDGKCHVVSKVSYTFYGYPDNDPPGADISEDCGRGMAAGGIGTHENPLTFATAPGEFDRCEIVYSPYLQKYLINEDYCEQCNRDWTSHIWHVDVWLGGNSTTYDKEQLKCENSLTSEEESQVVIKNPSKNLPVDRESLPQGFRDAY